MSLSLSGNGNMIEILGFTLPGADEILHALPVIVSLIIIEGLLSVDNALAIAGMASHLPHRQKFIALRLGIFGAYLFRFLALAAATWILETPSVMWLGAAYLLYLMSSHFTEAAIEGEEGGIAPGAGRTFLGTIIAIEVMDLSLSVDNVVAAAALDRRLWVVCTGVFIGILVLRFVAGACIRLIEKYPILEHTAFLLIGFVGFILVGELIVDAVRADGNHYHLHPAWKFAGIAAILALSIFYSRSPGLHRHCAPIFKVARLPMRLISVIVGSVLNVLLMPFKKLASLIRKAIVAGRTAE